MHHLGSRASEEQEQYHRVMRFSMASLLYLRAAVTDEHPDPLASPTAFVSAIVNVILWVAVGPTFDRESTSRLLVAATAPVILAVRKFLQ
jgi:hypothetical protein